jgi:3-methylcrotonyl-CoA carboxylase alpha subunit
MFKKILIANRGEIAVRVARTARLLGVQTVAVYSDVDANALHVRSGDEGILIGSASAKESYLNAEKIIEAAKSTGAEAIHPGYGFLSENAEFADACRREGIKFIGPSAESIRAMGLKSESKRIVEKAGVPLLPGYHGDNQDPDFLLEEAKKIGFPVLIKASAGGGGKGMRVVMSEKDFSASLQSACREAKNSFGNDHVLLERYILAPRHIEVQLFADQQGNCVHLFERDCSLQRRHQKVVEEAPAPGISSEVRQQLGETAIKVAKAVGYEGAGTVEFIVDEKQRFYFMEMNTRLQVEHPVTEMITGFDLVEWQLRVASGEPLPVSQKDIKISGHAIESRVYAESPSNDFFPSSGVIEYLRESSSDVDVRIDTGVQVGDEVGVFYDPMIAKLICWGPDRLSAIKKMDVALEGFRLAGFETNVSFLKKLIAVEDFVKAEKEPNRLTTGLIEKHKHELLLTSPGRTLSALALIVADELLQGKHVGESNLGDEGRDQFSPWTSASGWRLNAAPRHLLNLECDGEKLDVVISKGPGRIAVSVDQETIDLTDLSMVGDEIRVTFGSQTTSGFVFKKKSGFTVFSEGEVVRFARQQFDSDAEEAGSDRLVAPLPGHVLDILVGVDDKVEKGQPLVIVEAMKMEHTIIAPKAGVIKEIFFAPKDQVLEGAQLLVLEDER